MAQPFLALITPVGSTGPVDPGWSGGVAPPGGQPPLGIWGGGNVPYPTPPIHYPGAPVYPDNTLPQPPLGTWGGVAPPYPSHPIAPGGPPLGTWGGGNVPFPTPPIYIPGQPILPDSGDPTKAHIVVYVPTVGAVSFTVDLTQLPEPTPPVEPEPK